MVLETMPDKKRNKNGLGLLVVHLHEEYQCASRSGDCKEGIDNVRWLLGEATQIKIPIIFATLFSIPLFPKLYDNLPNNSYDHSAGNSVNCFSGDLTLAERLRNKGIKRLILMGYNKYCCVYHTAKGALTEGFQFVTAEDILFGPPKNQKNAEEINHFYQDTGIVYQCVHDLIKTELYLSCSS